MDWTCSCCVIVRMHVDVASEHMLCAYLPMNKHPKRLRRYQ